MNDIFTQKGNSWCNLRQIFKFSRLLVESIYHGKESVLWDMLPNSCKDIDNLNTFTNKVKMEN